MDIDGDGKTGFNPELKAALPPLSPYPPGTLSTDPGDTVLAAEALAVRCLLESLAGADVQVGLLIFAGEVDPLTGQQRRSEQVNARLVVPLTRDLERLSRGLEVIKRRRGKGASDFSAAIKLAVSELSAGTTARLEAKKFLLLLTDGVPTFPFGRGDTPDPEDLEIALREARRAAEQGVVIHTFAIGWVALARPQPAREIASITNGMHTPLRTMDRLKSQLTRRLEESLGTEADP
jgi:hypothetical protein